LPLCCLLGYFFYLGNVWITDLLCFQSHIVEKTMHMIDDVCQDDGPPLHYCVISWWTAGKLRTSRSASERRLTRIWMIKSVSLLPMPCARVNSPRCISWIIRWVWCLEHLALHELFSLWLCWEEN
jgi:hypothetical protein